MPLPANSIIQLSFEEAIEILGEIEAILISLHKIGSHYPEAGRDYERETTRYIDGWRVTRRLAHARRILSEKFDTTLGNDDMDDIERALEGCPYWSSPSSEPVVPEYASRDDEE